MNPPWNPAGGWDTRSPQLCQTGTYECFRLHTLENVFNISDWKPRLDKEDDDSASKESKDSRVQHGIGW
jgi:hypothetical protein|tara:strand:+ start:72 stop:278 length:207 start_codon:yes stop_codon:yes gene_type:complete